MTTAVFQQSVLVMTDSYAGLLSGVDFCRVGFTHVWGVRSNGAANFKLPCQFERLWCL